MSSEHFVVIGNGPAGNQAARTLKEQAPEARVTVISRNPGSSYKPHLLPRLLARKIEEKELYACSLDSYQERGIKLRCGQEVTRVNPYQCEILLDHREIIPFTGLIIAVGGVPHIPAPLYGFKDCMLTLKTLEDAMLWSNALTHAKSVLIIGGDLTSLAVTRSLLQMGKRVFFLLNEDALWPLRFNDGLATALSERLAEKGVEMINNRDIQGMTRLSDGTFRVQMEDLEIRTDLIGAFFGLVPEVRFLVGSGLIIDRGILVDDILNTGFEGIYATGDCAQIYYPEIRDYWVSIGYDNALTLGKIAAHNLLGCRIRAPISVESIYDIGGINVNTSWWLEF
ncbi:MAG: FAD-dependent oxidoreductase [Deltaproteobacteria bacterium]|nr:FAD-dependent oxidoreductase [Deltaproteobacteria bacterium]